MMDEVREHYAESKQRAIDTHGLDGRPVLTGIVTGACLTAIATAFLGAPGTRGAAAAVVAILATSVLYYRATEPEEPPLHEFYPRELLAADEADIDWGALAAEIGKTRADYEPLSAPDGEEGPWFDRLELCQDVARHIRDGGSIDVDRVLLS